ncbi:MAG: hypothetical protein LBI96_01365, partial [Odoribacteraceae bacterium]|nr:hypothetical protein [Odoribacteraceae bacterium]
MQKTNLETLFERYMTRQTSPEEEEALMTLLARGVTDEEREALVGTWFDRVPLTRGLSPSRADRLFRRITRDVRGRRSWWRRGLVAAGIALLLAGGGLLLWRVSGDAVTTSPVA